VGEYVQPPPRIEEHTKHRKLLNLYDLFPEVGEFTHIAPTASLVGEVYLDDCVNIWEGSVIRGDLNAVRLMYMVSIRENTCISTVSTLPTGIPSFTNIGTPPPSHSSPLSVPSNH
jgi:carbonic anhydrase/acetyltransferase-like protein (isoleucine patch superfamily)